MDEDLSNVRYTFKGEWREVENCKVTEFLITYFAADGSIELFDIKKHRLFLKRNKCHQVVLKDLFVGNSVNIFSRQINITDYGDSTTQQRLSVKMQKTFGLIKPNQIRNLGAVLEAVHEGGFTISRMRMINLTRDQGLDLYRDMNETARQSEMITELLSGPVVVLELLGNSAIQSWYNFVGPLDPDEARYINKNVIFICFFESNIYYFCNLIL